MQEQEISKEDKISATSQMTSGVFCDCGYLWLKFWGSGYLYRKKCDLESLFSNFYVENGVLRLGWVSIEKNC